MTFASTEMAESASNFESLFCHVGDLVLWLDFGSIPRCLMVCKAWRAAMQKHPNIWSRLLVHGLPILTCKLRPSRSLREDISRESFLRIIEPLRHALLTHAVYNRQTDSVRNGPIKSIEKYVGHDVVVSVFRDYGYREDFRYRSRNHNNNSFAFEVFNKCVWVFKMMLLTELDRDSSLWNEGEQNPYRVYFDKASMKVVSTASLTLGWSGYYDGHAQKSIDRVILDFSERGFTIWMCTPKEIIFEHAGKETWKETKKRKLMMSKVAKREIHAFLRG